MKPWCRQIGQNVLPLAEGPALDVEPIGIEECVVTPRANTPAGWLTLGFHKELQEANMIALAAMLDLMMEQYSFPASKRWRWQAWS